MEQPTRLDKFAQDIQKRAERVGNEKTDAVSRMARGLLTIERWLADRILEKRYPKVKLPEFLENIINSQERFFSVLYEIENGIMASLQEQYPNWAPEQFPKLNMCGYTSSAITEFSRAKGEGARVVYGHYRNDGEAIYHYWTEVSVDGEMYAVDATYGQFDPGVSEKIIVYPVDDLDKYGLKEYKPEDEPVLGDGDRMTLEALAANNGVLPMRDHIQDDAQRQKYVELTEVLAQKN